MRQIPLTINLTKRTCHTIQLLFSLHLLQSQRLLVLCEDGFALCFPIPGFGFGFMLFFGLGCFLVCVRMGQAWGACCMGWDGMRTGRHGGVVLDSFWVFVFAGGVCNNRHGARTLSDSCTQVTLMPHSAQPIYLLTSKTKKRTQRNQCIPCIYHRSSRRTAPYPAISLVEEEAKIFHCSSSFKWLSIFLFFVGGMGASEFPRPMLGCGGGWFFGFT